jgi:hypothetical protein
MCGVRVRVVLTRVVCSGDTQKNYESLGRTMAVPQTCCLALRAPLDLPFELGYGWFPVFNQDDGSRTRSSSLA